MVMVPTSSFFSVVVVGAMNPRVHSPAWYKLVGLVSEDEYEKAIQSVTFAVPQFARVELPRIEIQCQEGRWEASTHHAEDSDRLAELAESVFDTHLKHTPIQSFGYNFHFTFETPSESGPTILEALRGSNLSKDWDDAITGQFSVVRRRADFVQRTEVQAPSKKAVTIATNYHHQLQKPEADKKPAFIDMGPEIKRWLRQHREDALDMSISYADYLASLRVSTP